jgi:hypothetical protein
MEGHLTYKIGDEDRQFFFGNYALEQTLTHFDASVSDLSDLLGKQLLPFIRMFMYHAATYPIIKKGEIVNFTEFDIHEWIDQAGGSSGNLVMVVSKEIFRVLGLNTENDQPEQKKSEMKS